MTKFGQILRRFVQKPALAGFSIASLSLGLAATTAIYCIVDAVVLTPLERRRFYRAAKFIRRRFAVPRVRRQRYDAAQRK